MVRFLASSSAIQDRAWGYNTAARGRKTACSHHLCEGLAIAAFAPELAMSDNDYDWACRRLVKLGPVPLLCWLLTEFAQHLRFRHWLDTRTATLPGMPQSVRDTLAG